MKAAPALVFIALGASRRSGEDRAWSLALTPGTRLGAYELSATLGAGGMGEVYRARDAKLERDVAIKVLPLALASDAQRLARFEREVKLLASLDHPNIAHAYDFMDNLKP